MIGSRGIVEPCSHGQCAPSTAIAYCSLLAVAFVGSLYVFVPAKIRKLRRDHPTHIKYRTLACLIVCAGAILSYPSIFCADEEDTTTGTHHRPLFSVGRTILLPPLGERSSFRNLFGVLLHTCILYTGPSVACFLYTYELRKRSANPPALWKVVEGYFRGLLPSNEERLWIGLRNYVFAPWTEEIIFRGCMVQALLATGMSGKTVAFVAPLFFGIAHAHHAIQRLSNGEKPKMVLLATLFQFLYTSLFGSYASHAFVRVGSVLSVTLSHSYCNWMGLPDVGCLGNPNHFLYSYRRVLLVSYLVGIGAFWYLFRLDVLLPLPPELPPLIQQNQ